MCLRLLLLGRFVGVPRCPCGFKTRPWDQIKSVFSALNSQNNRTFLWSIRKYGLILNVLLVSAFSCVLVSKKTGRSQTLFLSCLVLFSFFFLFEIKCPILPHPLQMSCRSPSLLPGFSHSTLRACESVHVESLSRSPWFSCFSMQSSIWLPAPTSCRVQALSLHNLPSNVFAFHLTLHTGNEDALFSDTWRGGKILHPECYAIRRTLKKKIIPYFSQFFDCGRRCLVASCGIYEGVHRMGEWAG